MKKTTSISGQIGQLLIIGFDGTEMSPRLGSLLTRLQPAGVILFARNITSGEQTHKLLRECQSCLSTRLFTCVDMEGGKVDRFRNVTGPAPSAADVFATGDPKLYRRHGKIIGESCRALGFNTDFAPVVDLAFEASRNVMRSRAVSADAKEAIAYAREFLAGLRSAGVLGAIKHFPGLGEANLDTHHELPSVDKPWKKLWEADITPYRALRRESPLVLVGHAAYSAVTNDHTPASLSKKWITDILRKKIGYRGLVVSDDLEMGGVLKAAPIEQAAVGFIRGGGDLCLICHVEEHISRSYEALIREAERDAKFARRAKESAARVLAFKKKSKELKASGPAPTAAKVAKLSRQLWEFSEQVRLATIKRQDRA
ncbi:MAG TPA: glycoside hydrolase family 3 N-terminal domain-containing protein [Terriglobales bacterium]|nr:glycoside hydrolase family 3 N-terminal domain-containing protein [Terriglobales bacterium]